MKIGKLLFWLLLFSTSLSYGNDCVCSCIRENIPLKKQVEKSYQQSSLIFTGKVISIEFLNKSRTKRSSDPIAYTFEISKVFKGKVESESVTILSEQSSASCGFHFTMGKAYLVYSRTSAYFSALSKKKSDYITGLCDRNKLNSRVDNKEFKTLKKLKRSLRK